MTHVLFAALTLVALALGAGARAGTRAEATVVRLHVEAMAEPKPVLKYQLLPEVRELNPGNAAQNYLKCFMEQRTFFFTERGIDERTRYLRMPLAELAAAKVSGYGGGALRQADLAARMEGIDWQIAPQIQAGGLEVPPGELGPLQVLAQALNVRLRAEVAERHFEDAVRTAKTLFALGRHLGEYPAGLANQVGMGVVHLGLGSLQEMVQQPGCPNLYWALADLPCPLVDLRKGVQGDRTLVAADLQPIRGDVPMTEAELETCVGHLSGLIGFNRVQAGHAPQSLRTRLAARANDPEQLVAARQRLIEAGSAADFVLKVPARQVILLDEKLSFEIKRDASAKLLALPLRQIEPPTGDDGLFDDLLPPVGKLRRAQGALEQEIALLRHVEALRLHAAGHSGHLPATLGEIAVPLPDDPFTGKPFDYTVEGTSARLRGHSHQAKENDPGSGVRFEVIFRD